MLQDALRFGPGKAGAVGTVLTEGGENVRHGNDAGAEVEFMGAFVERIALAVVAFVGLGSPLSQR